MLVERRERGHERELGAVAENRYGVRHGGRFIGQAVKPPQHRAGDRARPHVLNGSQRRRVRTTRAHAAIIAVRSTAATPSRARPSLPR